MVSQAQLCWRYYSLPLSQWNDALLCWFHHCQLNPLWPSDAIWHHRSGSILVQVMDFFPVQHQAISWNNLDSLSFGTLCNLNKMSKHNFFQWNELKDTAWKMSTMWNELVLLPAKYMASLMKGMKFKLNVVLRCCPNLTLLVMGPKQISDQSVVGIIDFLCN